MRLFHSPRHPSSPHHHRHHHHFATHLAAYSTPDAAAVSDLRSAAESMIGSGHAKDCEAIYKAARKSAVDESLKESGFVAMSGQQLQRLEWGQLDRRIKLWLAAAAFAFRSTFPAERALADAVFAADRALADACYAAAVGPASDALLAFPELVAGRSKKSPERIFRFLDMYDLLAGLPTTTSPTAAAKAKVGEAVRATLSEFESAIQHDDGKAAVPGGGLHPATRYVMNYVAFLADYAGALAEILVGRGLPPLPAPVVALISDRTEVSLRLCWITLVLLSKVDSKAELYSDVGLSYLFLCNNLNYVANKIRSAAGLHRLFGGEWLAKLEGKVQIHAANYQRIVWGPAAAAAAAAEVSPAVSPEEVFRRFNGEFEEACRRQSGWVVAERKLRDGIKVSAARAVLLPYKELYRRHRAAAGVAVRYAPEDLGNQISDLFMRDLQAVGPR